MTEVCGIKMYKPMELREMLGVGRNKIYELLNDGAIEYVDLMGKRMITEEQIRRAISKLTVKASAPTLYPKR